MKYLFQSNKVSSFQLGEYLTSQGYEVKSIRRFGVPANRYGEFKFSKETVEIDVSCGLDVFIIDTSAPETSIWAAFMLLHEPGNPFGNRPPQIIGYRFKEDKVSTAELVRELELKEKTHDRYSGGHACSAL